MLCTSSRFKSTGLFLTVSDSAVSEILFSFPSTVFPSFVFTERLVPDTTVLNCDQSFTLAGFKPWAVSVSDGNKIQAKRARLMASLFLRGCIGFSPLFKIAFWVLAQPRGFGGARLVSRSVVMTKQEWLTS